MAQCRKCRKCRYFRKILERSIVFSGTILHAREISPLPAVIHIIGQFDQPADQRLLTQVRCDCPGPGVIGSLHRDSIDSIIWAEVVGGALRPVFCSGRRSQFTVSWRTYAWPPGHRTRHSTRSPKAAMEAPREDLAYVAIVNTNGSPDALGVMDVNPESTEYGSVVGRMEPSHLWR